MQSIRDLLGRRHLAALICAAALLVKLLVPAGYMIDGSDGRLAISICPGTGPVATMPDMPGMDGEAADRHGGGKEHDPSAAPCAFAGLTAAALDTVDPIQLAARIAFTVTTGMVTARLPALHRSAYLRPPLRGPPALL
ncbi:MAG: hypothetical protein DI530_08375 [Sphingomonas sp.]|uniref:DUF2946 family protein n=1 Tax=Sphingomonas sp. TaxID=28214 RepID=UPI000DBBE950|nr:DUF2946 family protein [Sphingomonas sp.]PZU79605.1 MAG: hypothetical protein DI530_08375 [Sphingomonas sp.]